MLVSGGLARAMTKCVPRWSRGGLRTVLTTSCRGGAVISSCQFSYQLLDNGSPHFFHTCDGHLDQMECQLGGISSSTRCRDFRGRSGQVDVPGATFCHADRSSGLPSGTSDDVVCVALRGERSSRASSWPPSPIPMGGHGGMARVGRSERMRLIRPPTRRVESAADAASPP
jgi:hypothetical protein